MDDDILKKLLDQIKEQNNVIKSCQMLLTIAVIVCISSIVIMLFIIFKGQGQFTKDKITIGGKIKNDETKLQKKILEQRKKIKELQSNTNKI